MFYALYRLRLTDDYHHVAFTATYASLRAQLNRAFIEFICGSGSRSAKLEVYHHYHGWHLVCVNHSYPIIKSPVNLDYTRISDGIHETLAVCNQWPTEEQKAQRKAKLLLEERELEVKIRRNRFTLVEDSRRK